MAMGWAENRSQRADPIVGGFGVQLFQIGWVSRQHRGNPIPQVIQNVIEMPLHPAVTTVPNWQLRYTSWQHYPITVDKH